TAQHHRRLGLREQNRSARRVYPRSRSRTGAFVFSIVYAVVIAVDDALATDRIDFDARWSGGTLVEAIRDAIVIAVDRTASRVDMNASGGRRAWALVDAVIDTITVRILGASARVDFCARDCIGASVDAVVDAVLVGVTRTSLRVHRGAGRCIGAGVFFVVHGIAIRVVEGARSCENREAGRCNDVTGPAAAGMVRVGGIEGAAFEAERRPFIQEDPVANAAMNSVVIEGVCGVVREAQAGVPTQDIAQVFVTVE